MEKDEQFVELAKVVASMTEFEWGMAKSKIDYLFNQKASKLQLERQEVEKILKSKI